MNHFDDVPIAQQSAAFLDLTGRDKWESWTPTRTSWTDVGTPTVTARYKRVGRMVFFQVRVVPDTSVATIAGTSYTSLPVLASGLSGIAAMVNATTNVSVGLCVIDVTNSRCYVPSQVASGNTFTIAGHYEV